MFRTYYVRRSFSDDDYQAIRVLTLHPERIVTICAWCPDSHRRTNAAVASGYVVSHGMCPACQHRMNAELDKENAHASV
jgi:hypothetical protein